jgi:hypothetical protein
MTAVVQSAWLLSVAAGNLVTVAVVGIIGDRLSLVRLPALRVQLAFCLLDFDALWVRESEYCLTCTGIVIWKVGYASGAGSLCNKWSCCECFRSLLGVKMGVEYKYPCPEAISALPRVRCCRLASVVRVAGSVSSCRASNPLEPNF